MTRQEHKYLSDPRVPFCHYACCLKRNWWACLDSNQEPDRYERQTIDHLR